MTALADTRIWARAPADDFVTAFSESGPLHPLTAWVLAQGPRADLHLWSDRKAQMHRARIVSGTVGLANIDWSPVRFQISARRPLNRLADGTLDSSWHPHTSSSVPVGRAVDFLIRALDEVAERARFSVVALAGRPMVTQEYAPLLAGSLTETPPVLAVHEALLPAPIPGGAPFFSSAPDAVIADDGTLELVRVYGARAPELRYAAAQAHVDVELFAMDGVERIVAARRHLGLRSAPPPTRASPQRAHVIVESGASERLIAQYEAVRSRLVERGVRGAARVRFTVV
ncbi:hypothetical protein D8Y23_11935 [Microbacterium enclense]|uniref:Uncharacterized protein n=1 Tax=Microbacterium enclense TaxID=993073 RepID=A0A3S3MWM4_9MICO|nr:hypothetical protein [Microbacterium enclense]RWR17275.1 hypothetical protein D8Y23_11935 [Microbacterium enclense]